VAWWTARSDDFPIVGHQPHESNMPKDRDRRSGLWGYCRGGPDQIKTVVRPLLFITISGSSSSSAAGSRRVLAVGRGASPCHRTEPGIPSRSQGDGVRASRIGANNSDRPARKSGRSNQATGSRSSTAVTANSPSNLRRLGHAGLGGAGSQNQLRVTGTNRVVLISRNRDRSQNTNNRHDDHQFDQSKTLLYLTHFKSP
jgi:hypothetical protein